MIKLLVLALAVAVGARVAGAATVEDGRLTADFDGVSLAKALTDIAAAGGFALTLNGGFGEAVHMRAVDLPVDRAIRQLAGDHGVVIEYAPGSPRGRLLAVRVYARGPEPAPAPQADTGSNGADPDLADRFNAARREIGRLVADGDATAVDKLVAMLDSADRMIANQAIRALEKIAGAPATAALHGALDHVDATVRRYAARGLAGRGGDPAIDDVLAVLLVDDPAPMVRRQAAVALGQRHAAAGYWALQQATDDEDETVRAAAAEVLAAW